jgi:uncharacterized protein YcfL
MKYFFLLILVPFFIISCAINPKSHKKKGEIVEIKLLPLDAGITEIALAQEQAVVIPKNVDWKFSTNSTLVHDKDKGYVAVYSANEDSHNFYFPIDNFNKFRLTNSAIEIKRFYNSTELVSSILLGFELSKDRTLLRLKPLKLKIDKTKVKLPRPDNDLDITISITIKGFWMDKMGVTQSKTVADVDIELKKIVLGKEYQLKKIGNEEYLSFDLEKTINKNIKSDWFAPVPLSVDEKGYRLADSLGNFSIFIEVAEIDDFGKRVEKIAKSIKTIGKSIPQKAP